MERLTLEQLKARAEKGDVDAMYEMGLVYFSPFVRVFATHKHQVGEDYREALEWYSKAAVHRHSKALFALGYMHEYGKGIPVNVIQALNFYRKANQHGYTCTYDIESVEDTIAADPALRAAAAVAETEAVVEERRAAQNARKQRALEQEAARLEQENARFQRDRATLDAEKARYDKQIANERAVWTTEKGNEQQQVARERAEWNAEKRRDENQTALERALWNAEKAREQKAMAEERAVLDADRASLQHDMIHACFTGSP